MFAKNEISKNKCHFFSMDNNYYETLTAYHYI